MPNRILHERICVSETVAKLSPEEERFFYRLLVQCDDYGRFDGRESVIRARCFPLQLDSVSEADITAWLAALLEASLVFIYLGTDGGNYLQVVTWDRYQQTRAKRSKYPDPAASASNGNQMQSIDGIGSRIREARSETPEREAEARSEGGARAPEAAADAAPPDSEQPREVIPKTRPHGVSLVPLLDAFSAVGLDPPSLEGRESAAAAALLQRAPPERIAACWQEIAAGEYGGRMDQVNLSFSWLHGQNRFVNWISSKEGKFGASGHGTGRRNAAQPAGPGPARRGTVVSVDYDALSRPSGKAG